MSDETKVYQRTEAANALGISVRTLRRWIKDGHLPGKRYYTLSELHAAAGKIPPAKNRGAPPPAAKKKDKGGEGTPDPVPPERSDPDPPANPPEPPAPPPKKGPSLDLPPLDPPKPAPPTQTKPPKAPPKREGFGSAW